MKVDDILNSIDNFYPDYMISESHDYVGKIIGQQLKISINVDTLYYLFDQITEDEINDNLLKSGVNYVYNLKHIVEFLPHNSNISLSYFIYSNLIKGLKYIYSNNSQKLEKLITILTNK